MGFKGILQSLMKKGKNNQAISNGNAHETIDNEIAKNEYVSLLNNVLERQIPRVNSRSSLPMRNLPQDIFSQEIPFMTAHPKYPEQWKGRIIRQFDTPEGKRFYPGQGQSRDQGSAYQRAHLDASSRMMKSPGDSLTTELVNRLKEHGDLFK